MGRFDFSCYHDMVKILLCEMVDFEISVSEFEYSFTQVDWYLRAVSVFLFIILHPALSHETPDNNGSSSQIDCYYVVKVKTLVK